MINPIKRPRIYQNWSNVPWGGHPDKVDVTRTGHLDPDEPQATGDVQDYLACARSGTDGIYNFLAADPKNDSEQVFQQVVKDYNMVGQLLSWRIGGYEGMPLLWHPQNTAFVLDAHKAVQDNAADLKRKVKAPFDGLDLNQMQEDATRLSFIRNMKLAHSLFTDTLDKVDAFLSQSIAQRLYPIYTDAYPVVMNLKYLARPLEPLRQLFAGAAALGQDTKDKIANALRRHGGQGTGTPTPGGTSPGGPPGGTPPGMTGTGDTGAHGGTPAPATGPGPTAPGHAPTTHGHAPTTHKKNPPVP